MIHRNLFRACTGLLVMAAMVHVSTLWPRVADLARGIGIHGWLIVAGFAVSALTALAACALAALLLWKAADRADGRMLALFLALLAIFWGSTFRFLGVDLTSSSVSVNLSYGPGWISQSALAALILALAAFLRFSALFPHPLTGDRLPKPRFPSPFRPIRRALLRPGVVWGCAIGVIVVQRYLVDVVLWFAGPPGAREQAPAALMPSLYIIMGLIATFALLAMIAGARNLRDAYRIAAATDRRRIQWIVAGFTAAWWMLLGAIGLVVLVALLDFDAQVLGAAIPIAFVLAPLVVVLSASVGILYSGAIDPALALRKSTIYGILGATGIVVFTIAENALSAAVELWLDLPGFVGSVLAGVLVAIVLYPFRGVLRRWIPHGPGKTLESKRAADKDSD